MALESLGEPAGAPRQKTDHIDDDIGLEVADRAAEGPGLLLPLAVHSHGPDRLPGAVLLIGLALAASRVDDVETGLDQSRHQIGADVSAAADDHHARHPILL